MTPLRKILLYLETEVEQSDVVYVKSATIAEVTGLSAREVGVRLSFLADADDAPVEVSEWSHTNGTRTWRISTEREDISDYLTEMQGEPEPLLC